MQYRSISLSGLSCSEAAPPVPRLWPQKRGAIERPLGHYGACAYVDASPWKPRSRKRLDRP
eukprot:scaffold301_cov243-Pinguiococcus_pyrenoidosus.AAC.64